MTKDLHNFEIEFYDIDLWIPFVSAVSEVYLETLET